MPWVLFISFIETGCSMSMYRCTSFLHTALSLPSTANYIDIIRLQQLAGADLEPCSGSMV